MISVTKLPAPRSYQERAMQRHLTGSSLADAGEITAGERSVRPRAVEGADRRWEQKGRSRPPEPNPPQCRLDGQAAPQKGAGKTAAQRSKR
jgi:hypothetical protein